MLNTYANFLNINPYAFFGVNHMVGDYVSNKIWTYAERSRVSAAMHTAQLELEHNLGYLLTQTLLQSEPHVHDKDFIRLDHGYLTGLGTYNTTSLTSAAINYSAEPATVQITTATPANIHIYHSAGQEIIPLSSAYASGVLTLSLARYDLCLLQTNPVLGWSFTDLSNYLVAVVVKSLALTDMSATQTILNAKMGLITTTTIATGQTLYINYLSGLTTLDLDLKRIWIAFAHSLMDIQPSDDPSVNLAWLWARDLPKEMPTAQKECPFGQFAGAYQAWRHVSTHRLHRATPL